MSLDTIKKAVESAVAYLGEHTDEAHYTDSIAKAVLEEDLRFRIEDASGHKLISDMPTSIGGGDTAPSPGWLMRAALASCTATLIAMRAAQMDIQLTQLEVDVDSESDDRGILGMDASVPAGPLKVRVLVKIGSQGADQETLQEVADWGGKHCPVTDAIIRAIPVRTEVELQ
jgi:uncharacterized OsmC-like protein